jgi:hypothetical protein
VWQQWFGVYVGVSVEGLAKFVYTRVSIQTGTNSVQSLSLLTPAEVTQSTTYNCFDSGIHDALVEGCWGAPEIGMYMHHMADAVAPKPLCSNCHTDRLIHRKMHHNVSGNTRHRQAQQHSKRLIPNSSVTEIHKAVSFLNKSAALLWTQAPQARTYQPIPSTDTVVV